MIRRLSAAVAAGLVLAGCAEPASDAPLAESTPALPIHYAEVDAADFTTAEALTTRCEAEEARLREHLAALEAFDGTPTLAGYYRALDSLQSSLTSMQATASSLSGVHPDEAVRTAGEDCEALLSKLGTDLSLSRPVHDAVAALDVDGADATTRHSVASMLQDFRLSGVDRDEATRARIRELNERITALGQRFDRIIREDVRAVELESAERLEGLPEDFIAAHAPGEDGRIRVTTRYPDLFPVLEYAEDDDLRRELSRLNRLRGWPDNEAAFRDLLEARHELATLVGFDNYAELVTADKMAGSPERVAAFIEALKGDTGEVQDREYAVLLDRLRQEDPDAERLRSWQRRWIASKVSRERFGVDSREVRTYFSYENTRDGLFDLVQDLFGVRIEPWETDTWHEDVEAYSLWEGNELLGRFYLDMHPREGKYQHAAMFPFVVGLEGRLHPVAALVCNFPRGDAPMQFSQVETFLHEFGHLLHFQFAGHQPWTNVAGIATEWDFVEAPSQMLEEWVWDYETVSSFARNAEGEPLPEDLHDAMVAERDFGLGMGTRGQLAYAKISLSMYDRPPSEVDFDATYDSAIEEMTRFESIPDTHGWASFGHLNGYSAIYYTYQWSKAIATDLFTRFEAAGLRDRDVARDYRETVLAAGGSRPAEELVTDFLGRPTRFEPYAERLRSAVESWAEDGEESAGTTGAER